MERISVNKRPRQRIMAGLAFLAVFLFCAAAWAGDETTGTLTITPGVARPGSQVKFHLDIFYNPDFAAYGVTPGKRMRIFVTRSDFAWISEKLDIVYPGMGSVHVDFATGYTIPADSAAGQVYYFSVVWGPWWRLSNIAEVKVFKLRPIIVQKKK